LIAWVNGDIKQRVRERDVRWWFLKNEEIRVLFIYLFIYFSYINTFNDRIIFVAIDHIQR